MLRGKDLSVGLVPLGFLASAAGAQSVLPLIREGETIIGMGAMTSSTYVGANDSGTWIAFVDTEYPETTLDGAILRSGFVTLREGSQLFAPLGFVIEDFDSIDISKNGDLALAIKLRSDTASNNGAYWNTVPVALKGGILNAPGVGPNSTWLVFDVVKINENNSLFVMGDIQNTAVTGTKESALVRFDVDPIGNVLSTAVLATKGMLIPAIVGEAVKELSNTDHVLSVNKHGDFLTMVTTQPLGLVLYMKNLDTIVAQTDGPSPVPGRNWRTLNNGPRMYINDFGEYVFGAAVYGDMVDGQLTSIYVVEKSGQVFAKEGDILPEFSANPITKGSAAPIIVTNSGDVYWWCQSSSGTDDAFMRNYKPIVQVNRTTVGNNLVSKVEQTENAFAVSTDGRFWVGRVVLGTDTSAILFVDFGVVVPIPGCSATPNPGTLRVTDGLALPGNHLVFEMDNGQAPGVQPIILGATQPRTPGSDCGVIGPRGELLISPAHRIVSVYAPTWNGIDPSTVDVAIPNEIALVDGVFYAQGFFWDIGDQSPAENLRMTNALRIEFGAP